MLYLICCVVTCFACVVGTICGMGGGIIIKPALDAVGLMPVETITFLSGCTVISMTCWSVGKTLVKKEAVLDLRNTPVLALAAALGGLLGKQLFTQAAALFPDRNTAGGVQACLLFAATLATLIYTLRKDSLRGRQAKSLVLVFGLGLALGTLGAFLGIGGGPFNVAALTYFFAMPTKRATQNSLFIVLFSQLTSTLKTILFDGVPAFDPGILAGMILLGILGSEVGRRINKRINDRQATFCLEGCMVLILGINVFNIIKYLH